MNRSGRLAAGWLIVGIAGYSLVPWYALQGNVFELGWLRDPLGKANAPALFQGLIHGVLPDLLGMTRKSVKRFSGKAMLKQ